MIGVIEGAGAGAMDSREAEKRLTRKKLREQGDDGL